MSGSHDTSLGRVLHIHVFVIVTVSVRFEIPATTILELLGDLPPIPVVGHPACGRCTVSSVNFENVEARGKTKHDSGHGLPEASPFDNSTVLVNDFTLLETQVFIRRHARGLNERLELVTRMSRGTLNTENSLDRFFTEDGVTKTISNVRELL